MRDLTVPRVALGDDDEMLLAAWTVEEGQAFDDGAPLLELETDKAAMEVEADGPGVLALRLRGPGAKVAPGEVIAVVADPGEEYDLAELQSRHAAEVASTAGVPAGVAADRRDGDDRLDAAASAPAATRNSTRGASDGALAAVAPPAPAVARNDVAGSVIAPAPATAPPLVGATVPGFTAPGLLYGLPARRRPASPAPVAGTALTERQPTREPLSRHRRALARLMTASAAIPQFSVHRELPMQEALRVVAGLRRAGVAATITDVLLRATALALVRHPEMDGCVVEDAVERTGVPAISLAADSPSGVVAPVVRGAERLSWRQLAQERKRVVDGARRGRLLPADLAGGTFSISNVGALGGDLVIPMLTPPQIAILGVGRIRSGWGDTVAGAALVADHRAVDGADSARFLATLAELLVDPGALDGEHG